MQNSLVQKSSLAQELTAEFHHFPPFSVVDCVVTVAAAAAAFSLSSCSCASIITFIILRVVWGCMAFGSRRNTSATYSPKIACLSRWSGSEVDTSGMMGMWCDMPYGVGDRVVWPSKSSSCGWCCTGWWRLLARMFMLSSLLSKLGNDRLSVYEVLEAWLFSSSRSLNRHDDQI